MKNNIITETQQWDSQFYGISCAKVIMTGEVSLKQWEKAKKFIKLHDFVVIKNKNNDIRNSIFIGELNGAWLADINVQFQKKLTNSISTNITDSIVEKNLSPREDIINIVASDFSYSRFLKDPVLLSIKPYGIYKSWIKNAFKKQDKYFVILEDINDIAMGFILFHIEEKDVIIELIAVKTEEQFKGVGKKLMDALERWCTKNMIVSIKVGTQCENIHAMNFYYHCGFKIVNTFEVYHYHSKGLGDMF